jgi:hypothetical protein
MEAFDVVVVSPRNHFVFTPMLPSTAVGSVEFRSVLEPVRSANPYLTYFEAEATELDLDKQTAICRAVSHTRTNVDAATFHIHYDYLLAAVGEQPGTFGARMPYPLSNSAFCASHQLLKLEKIMQCLTLDTAGLDFAKPAPAQAGHDVLILYRTMTASPMQCPACCLGTDAKLLCVMICMHLAWFCRHSWSAGVLLLHEGSHGRSGITQALVRAI